MKPTDRHHITKKPSVVVDIPHKEHQKLHNKLPVINELTLKVKKYDQLTKLKVMITNWNDSYEREFGEKPNLDFGLKQIYIQKYQIWKDLIPVVYDDVKNINIEGVSIMCVAKLLAYAHPSRFPNIGRYLYYCGYTKASKITKKYNRKVCGLVYVTANSLVRNKNNKYYPLYLKIKRNVLQIGLQ